MRTLKLIGTAVLALGLPAAVNGQPTSSADQLNAQSQPAEASTTVVMSADPYEPDAVVTNMPGNMSSVPSAAMNKAYPVCSARMQDNCQNPGEGGAPGRSRALKYWPGRPASQM
jgi:hypothetical protein